VLGSREATEEFFRRYCVTGMQLEENILSRRAGQLAGGWHCGWPGLASRRIDADISTELLHDGAELRIVS
jgi:hypothetical protein